MSKILVVDDERDIVDLLTLHLQREGHIVHAVGNGLGVLPAAVQEEPDLIVLDLMLPGLDGVQVHKRLRADTRTRHIPVIMLTARAQTHDRIAGLESGADDYLTKPFSPRELMLRINAVLRRSKKVVTLTEQRIGPFRLDRKNMVLSVDDVAVDLTITELKLATVLMENPDVVHDRAELLNHVWGYADNSQSRTLDTHVKRLREKLGDYGKHIQTMRGHGYYFCTQPDSNGVPATAS
ncbi:MAG: response regulator transcription factor [Verrucomicrobiaceae bacterium]|nr:response regulator transcription factor [Verrucomicrobiaceae bacterium]